ncbi:MAG: hypothetical protein ACFFCZ_29190 [Promethearchaeota archaeon]
MLKTKQMIIIFSAFFLFSLIIMGIEPVLGARTGLSTVTIYDQAPFWNRKTSNYAYSEVNIDQCPSQIAVSGILDPSQGGQGTYEWTVQFTAKKDVTYWGDLIGSRHYKQYYVRTANVKVYFYYEQNPIHSGLWTLIPADTHMYNSLYARIGSDISVGTQQAWTGNEVDAGRDALVRLVTWACENSEELPGWGGTALDFVFKAAEAYGTFVGVPGTAYHDWETYNYEKTYWSHNMINDPIVGYFPAPVAVAGVNYGYGGYDWPTKIVHMGNRLSFDFYAASHYNHRIKVKVVAQHTIAESHTIFHPTFYIRLGGSTTDKYTVTTTSENIFWYGATSAYQEPGGGGGGGGCPNLQVFDGSEYVDYGVLPIHNDTDLYSDTFLTRVIDMPAIINDKMHIRLNEISAGWDYTESYIDQVRLEFVDAEGESTFFTIQKAKHSDIPGNQKQLVADDDDIRLKIVKGQMLDLFFRMPEGFDVDDFLDGYFVVHIDGHNPKM